MKSKTLLLFITSFSLAAHAQPLRRIGEPDPRLTSPIADAFVVRYPDVQGVTPPFRISSKLIEGPHARVFFDIEVDRGLLKASDISLSSGKRTEPELITPLAYFTDASGIHRTHFEVNPNYKGELWLIFWMDPKNPNDKGTIYLLDLKSWPMTFISRNGQKTGRNWPNQTLEPTTMAVTPPATQEPRQP